jgi:hypothetical protein
MDHKVRRGADKIQRLASYQVGSSQSLEALLFAVVVESWMSFETLASDLFYTALDNGLSEWRIRTGQKFKEFTGGSNWEPQKITPRWLTTRKQNTVRFCETTICSHFRDIA